MFVFLCNFWLFSGVNFGCFLVGPAAKVAPTPTRVSGYKDGWNAFWLRPRHRQVVMTMWWWCDDDVMMMWWWCDDDVSNAQPLNAQPERPAHAQGHKPQASIVREHMHKDTNLKPRTSIRTHIWLVREHARWVREHARWVRELALWYQSTSNSKGTRSMVREHIL